jgi:hypothetical protein
MDYNIKVKYDSAGGKGAGAFATRRKVIDAQRQAAQKTSGTASPTLNRELVNSIQKLIASNKELSQSIRANRGGGGPGGGPGGGGRVPRIGGSAGIGGMGASLPIVGAAVAGIGFAIQKINQIGNAYIELVSQQAGTVGVGGMRSGRRGMYLQTELGAMEKAHRMSAGRFGGAGAAVSDRAVQIGSIFGMGAGEVGQISGAFARGRGNLGRTAEIAAGGGIETEMPLLLQGMASILEEAVTNGVNSSSLADDLGDQLVSLTRATGTNSVQMAMNIVRSQRGVQQQVSQGQISGYEQFMSYRAAGTAINRRLADPERREEYLVELRNQGIMSLDEINAARARASAAGRSITMADLEAQGTNIGPSLRRFYSARGETDQQQATIEEHRRNFGAGPEGLRRYLALNSSGMDPNQVAALWNAREIPAGAQTQGAAAITSKMAQTEGSAAFSGLARTGQRQGLMMEHGAGFADISLRMENSMIQVVRSIAPVAEKALPLLGTAVETLAGQITTLTTKIQQSNQSGGLGSAIWTYMTGGLFSR